MFPNLTTYIWDHSNDEVQRTFLSTFLKLTDAGSPLDGTFHEIRLHQSPCTKLCLTPDQNFAISCDQSGTIFVCDVEFMSEGRLAVRAPPASALALEKP